MEQSRVPSCRAPFDSNSGLCGTCRTNADELGLLRCARVVAESPAMRELLRRVLPIARSSASVVIQGETGTGKEVERRHIERVLESCRGNHAHAARILDIGRNTLWRKMRLHKLRANS